MGEGSAKGKDYFSIVSQGRGRKKTIDKAPRLCYPAFVYYQGLGLIRGFDVELHYREEPEQLRSIRRCLREKSLPVYAMPEEGGVIVEKGSVRPFGETVVFR